MVILRNIIKELNTKNTTQISVNTVTVNNRLSREIPIASGIWQGSSIRPMLFTAIRDKIMMAVIISEDRDDFQMFFTVFLTGKKCYFNIYVSKRKLVGISKKQSANWP